MSVRRSDHLMAKIALARLKGEEKLGFPWRDLDIRCSEPSMYRHTGETDDGSGGGAYVVVPFERWAPHCSGAEVAAILTYWEASGSLIPKKWNGCCAS